MHNSPTTLWLTDTTLHININTCGIYTCDTSWSMHERIIPDYDLLYIAQGSGTFIIDNTSFTARPGDLFIIPPGIKHAATHNLNDLFTVWAMHFTAHIHGIWELPALLSLPPKLSLPPATPLPNLLKKAIIEQLDTSVYSNDAAQLYLRLVLIELTRMLQHHETGLLPLTASSQILIIAHFILQNRNRKFTLGELAKGMSMSSSLLQKTTQKYAGMSPLNLVNRIKINAAKISLKNKQQPITTTAYTLGYTDTAYFSRVFKKHTGMSPKQYQQEIHRITI